MTRTWQGLLLGLAAALSLFPAQSVQAHRMQAAMSVVEIGPQSGLLEVTHRLFVHDLEHALDLSAVGLDWFETPQGQSAIRAYCERQFFLGDAQGRRLPLRFIGAELAGDLLYVYFDSPAYSGPAVVVDSDLLQDFSPDQVNQVNVRRHGQTRSALFPFGTQALTIPFP